MRLKMKTLKLQLTSRPRETNFHYDSWSYALNFDEGSYYHPKVFSPGIPAPHSPENIPAAESPSAWYDAGVGSSNDRMNCRPLTDPVRW
jgi:hypothetical protein